MESGTKKRAKKSSGPVFTNLEKPLYPNGFTKAQVIDYYRQIAPAILPYLKDRAVTLKRYPNGSDGMFFFEKHCSAHRPSFVKTTKVPSKRSESVEYCLINDLNTLLWTSNLAALELHVLLSKAKSPAKPTLMVFDLDPGEGAEMRDCVRVALDMRQMLEKFDLESFAKTSGGKGIHLYVPLNTPCTFIQTKAFANAVATIMARQDPERVTTIMAKHQRTGKVFIDWSQNDEHKTTACVYSLRAKPTPTVSTPITWEEIKSASRSKKPKLSFEADEVIARVKKQGDLFEPVLKLKQKLPMHVQ